MRRFARPVAALLGLAVSAVFAYLAVRRVELADFWDYLRDSNYWWVAPSLAALALCVVVKALRWRLLFPPATRPSLAATTRALLVGYFFNNVLPARMGEALRVVALHREARTSRAEALATAVSERVYDVLALLVLLLVATPFVPEVTWLRSAWMLGIVLLGACAIGYVVLARYGERPARFLLRPLLLLPGMPQGRVDEAARSLVRGLSGFHAPVLAATAFGVTLASWLVLAASFWLLMPAFSLETGYGAALLVVVATNLAMIIPSSPAAVGVFEAATLVALGAYGVDGSQALAYAVVLHAVNFLPFIVAGLVVLHRHAFRLENGRPAPSRSRRAAFTGRAETSDR